MYFCSVKRSAKIVLLNQKNNFLAKIMTTTLRPHYAHRPYGERKSQYKFVETDKVSKNERFMVCILIKDG